MIQLCTVAGMVHLCWSGLTMDQKIQIVWVEWITGSRETIIQTICFIANALWLEEIPNSYCLAYSYTT